jgi:glycosyltransferase involved in cell wall biosynthesis
MPNPLLSVVVPSYNSAKYIVECLESLRESRSSKVEYLLIDGGSTDSTMDIVESYKDLFSVIISEPDQGQSDAFNKGFALAKGEYFTWLNSDDVFCPGALTQAVEWIKKEHLPWYAANVVYMDSDSQITRCCQSGGFEGWALKFGVLNVFGPSTIFHRDLFDRLGGFREDFHYCMDTEYWWRIASSGIKYQRIPLYLWALRLHEDAKTASSITGGVDKMPIGMRDEISEYIFNYCPRTSKLMSRLGLLCVKSFRMINGSYLRSAFNTYRRRGLSISSLKSITEGSPN